MANPSFCPPSSDTRAGKQLLPRSCVHCTHAPHSWLCHIICVTNSCRIIAVHNSIPFFFFSNSVSVSSWLAHSSLEDLCAVGDSCETYCKCAQAFILSPTQQRSLPWAPSLSLLPSVCCSFASRYPPHLCFPSLSQSVS